MSHAQAYIWVWIRPLGLDPHGGDHTPGYDATPAPPTPTAWGLPREIEEGLSMWAEDPIPREARRLRQPRFWLWDPRYRQ